MFLESLHRQSHNRMVVPVAVKWPWGIKLFTNHNRAQTVYTICTLLVLNNTLRPRQKGRHFPDDIFKYIFFNENIWISIRFSLKFVPKFPIENKPVLVQAASHCLNQWWLIYWHIYASIGLNEHQLMADVTNENTKRVSCNKNIVMLREFPLNIDQRVLLIENHYCFGWMAKCSKRWHTFQITTMTQFSDIYPSVGCEEL